MKTKTAPRTQLKLFETEKAAPVTKRTYSSLSIHEKINYRSNMGAFAGTVYLTRYYYFHQILHKPVIDALNRDYYDHYNLNSGGCNRHDNWRKQEALKKELFETKRFTKKCKSKK